MAGKWELSVFPRTKWLIDFRWWINNYRVDVLSSRVCQNRLWSDSCSICRLKQLLDEGATIYQSIPIDPVMASHSLTHVNNLNWINSFPVRSQCRDLWLSYRRRHPSNCSQKDSAIIQQRLHYWSSASIVSLTSHAALTCSFSGAYWY